MKSRRLVQVVLAVLVLTGLETTRASSTQQGTGGIKYDVVDLGMIHPEGYSSVAVAINDTGDALCLEHSGGQNAGAFWSKAFFVFRNGQRVPYGASFAANLSFAPEDVNDRGQVVGSMVQTLDDGTVVTNAYMLSEDAQISLGTLGAGPARLSPLIVPVR